MKTTIVMGAEATDQNIYGPSAEKIEFFTRNSIYGSAFLELSCIVYVAWDRAFLSAAEARRFKSLNVDVSANRAAKNLNLAYLSSLSIRDLGPDFSVESVNRAQEEFLQSLEHLRACIVPDDKFDVDSFLRDCNSILSIPFASLTEIDDLTEKILDLPPEDVDPWVGLDLDNPHFHPDARAVLDEPFYWDIGDPQSPHGSDLGADILNAYINSVVSSDLEFLDETLASMNAGYSTRTWLAELDDYPTSREERTQRKNRNIAVVAVALAEIKKSGKCSREIAALGRAAIANELARPIESSHSQLDNVTLRNRLAKTDSVFRKIEVGSGHR